MESFQIALNIYKDELNAELTRIMDYWSRQSVDNENGGFIGKIDNQNVVDRTAPKGSVLNARILWSFSAAYIHSKTPGYLELAERAYQYIKTYFIDREFGGVYWTVDYQGKPQDTKKQVYSIAFTIYGLSEYYRASKHEEAKDLAISLFKLLVEKSYDMERTGYMEAFSRDWQTMDDLRLSPKDANENKTMNTHLHVLEGYASLYRIWPNPELRNQIVTLIENFFNYFIDPTTNHLKLFFDENWNSRSSLISYGHDIEAAWLVLQAAQIISEEALINKWKPLAVAIAKTTITGLDADYGLWYEYEPAEDHLIREKHWWVQAEAMIGFFNAWELTKAPMFAELSLKNWTFVKNNIVDYTNGEWFWGTTDTNAIMPAEDKAGLWKCPYHNSRACLEIINRIGLNIL